MRVGRRNGSEFTKRDPGSAWPSDIGEAKAIQLELAASVRCRPLKSEPRLVAGVDAAFTERRVFAAACIYSYPRLEPVEDAFAACDLVFPYVPGYLTFREGPALLEAITALSQVPDLVLVDGQGIAHPRGLGIASHIGVLLDVPTVGCAKSRLVGEYREPGLKRGARTRLIHQGKTVGAVVRTRTNIKPLFVSPGHLVDISDAVRLVLWTTSRFRNPEPLRRADALSKAWSREGGRMIRTVKPRNRSTNSAFERNDRED